MEKEKNNRSSFSGKIGFVLSAAGASVGLGNIWRFPYLAAKYGGGIFLLIYILLALTFGYTMIVAESALGRMTRKSPVGAFRAFGKKAGWLSFGGWINAIIPVLIVPYYSVIGGWVIKYFVEYLKGNGAKLAEDGYFSKFISNGLSTEICFIVFCMFTLIIIYAGVRNGIERVSKFMMPILVVLSVIIAIYSVTRPGALAGVKFVLPGTAKSFPEDFFYFHKWHRVYIRAKLHQLVAVTLGQNVGAHGHDLSQLDEGGAEICENEAKLLRGDASGDGMLVENGCNFF